MSQSNEARASQLLSLRSRAREPQLLSPHAPTPMYLEPAHRNESSPHSPQLKKAHAQQRRPNTAKNK